ncbi:hypothetical protein Tco_1216282 [Tanacetum coccineum]
MVANMFNNIHANAGLEDDPTEGDPVLAISHLWAELVVLILFHALEFIPPVESNAMRNVMQKFKFLKGKIREWLKVNKSKNIYNYGILKEEIKKIDAKIDMVLASDSTINRRMDVLIFIQT